MSNPEVEEINSASNLLNEEAKEIANSENFENNIQPSEELSHELQTEVNRPVAVSNIPEKTDEVSNEIEIEEKLSKTDEIVQEIKEVEEILPLNQENDSLQDQNEKIDGLSNQDINQDIRNLREEERIQATGEVFEEESKGIKENEEQKYDNSSVGAEIDINEINSNMKAAHPEEGSYPTYESMPTTAGAEISSLNKDSINQSIEENSGLREIGQEDISISPSEEEISLIDGIEQKEDFREINSKNKDQESTYTYFNEANQPDPLVSQPEAASYLNESEHQQDLIPEGKEDEHHPAEINLLNKDQTDSIQESESMLDIPRKSESCYISGRNEDCSPELAPEQTESNDSKEIIDSRENTFCYMSVRDENSISHDNLDEIISQSMIIHNEADLSMKQPSRSSKQPNRAKTNLISPKYSNKRINQSFRNPLEDEPAHPKKKAVNAAEAIAIGQSLYNKGKEFLSNRETKLEKIFTDTHSFKPTINSKSAKLVGGIHKEKNELYSDKIKRPKYVPEEEHKKEKKKLKLKDFLDRNYAKPLEHVKEKKIVVPKEEVDEECTFAPKIDGKSKTIGSMHRNLYDLAAEKKSKMDQKIQEAKMQKEKEELKECTFQPTVFKQIDTMKSPKNKFVSHSIFSNQDSFLNTIG
ncbi:unnamed protein product [Blepharisma stoltei]|uniref:Uncharacterized protein n=1 Tax=Blepharisma stoltei TaxID=1481888 RepID=A0AAU9JHI2_9CILI|nr:unnamed protein product [Blepharisma stoltei]